MSAGKGAAWLGVCRVGSVMLSALSVIVLARLLSPQDFGLAAPATVILALASALFDGALGTSIVRRRVLDEGEIEETFGAALICGFSFALVVAIASPLIAALIGMREATSLLALSATLIFIRSGMVILASYHQRIRSFKWLATASMSSAIVGSASITIILAALGFGAWSLTIGAICAATSEVVILYVTLDRRLRPRFGLRGFRRLGRDEGAYAATSLANWGALSGPTLVASAMIGIGQVGVYSRAQRILDIAVSVLGMPLQRVLLPKFVDEAGNTARMRLSFQAVLETVLLGCSLIGLLSCLHATTIVAILLGSKWGAAVPVVQAFMIVLSARCAYKVTEAASIAAGASGAVLFRQLSYLVLAIVGAIVGSRYGALGIAVGTSCAVVGFYILSLSYARRQFAIRSLDLIVLHARALAPAAVILLVHQFISLVPLHGPAWVRDVLGGSVEIVVVGAILLLVPDSLINPVLSKLRAPVRLRLRLAVPSAPALQVRQE